MPAKILIVDDEDLIRWSLSEDLAKAGYKAVTAGDFASAVRVIETEAPDAVLTDLRLGADSGIDVLRAAHRVNPGLPVVLMTGFADLTSAVEALREGAADYVSKPLQLAGLKVTLKRVLETATLKSRLQQAHQKRRDRYSLDTIVCASPSMREAVETARKIAASPAGTVLLLGESGCGKDRLARAIHFAGPRAVQPLMEINCTAIPEALLESELFGYEKGAFTGAAHQKKGLFELSDGGTVFLNEIGHMPLGLQGKVLRFMEEKTFMRVGGNEDITVDVRIVAATNEDLERAVAEKRFRGDLYYRVNVLTIRLLPLRERREDVLPLVEVLLGALCAELGKPRPALPPETLAAMQDYAWPGNVRELRNVLERMIILGETGFRPVAAPRVPAAEGGAPSDGFALPPAGVKLEDVERSLVAQALKAAGGSQQKAAQLLGLSRDALRRRLEKFGLKPASAVLLLAALSLTGAVSSFAAKEGAPPVDEFLARHAEDAARLRADPVVHAPVAAGQCSACHASPKDPSKLKDELKALCLSCHKERRADLAKASVHLPFKEADCSSCHRPHSSREAGLLVDDERSLCAACHAPGEEPMRGAHGGVAAFAGRCTRCHSPHGSANAKLLVETGLHLPFAARNCAACHRTPGSDGRPAVKPAEEACLPCHRAVAEADKKAAVHPPFARRQCALCHEPHASPRRALARAALGQVCRSCHAGVPETGHPVASHPTFVKDRLDCAGCHPPHGAPWPRLLKSRPQEICATCHQQ